MLKAVYTKESRDAVVTKVSDICEKFPEMKLPKAAELIEEKIEETLTYYSYPDNRWVRIRINNALERIMREVRRPTRLVGAFPDVNSALMLVAASLRHLAGSK